MATDIESTTMYHIASMIFRFDPKNADRVFEDLSYADQLPWHMNAVAILNAAEPLWRSRVAEAPERAVAVGALESLSRMALVRGIPMLGRAESTYDREKIVQDWIQECADRYAEIGRV